MKKQKFTLLLFIILLAGFGLFGVNLLSGYEKVMVRNVFTPENDVQHLIISYRLYKIIAVLLAGISLPVSGFLMQELFRNPLAGPSVLGISSSSALFVGLIVFLGLPHYLETYQWLEGWIIILAALTGAILASCLLLVISQKIKEVSAFIIVGFLISSFCNSIIGALQFYSQSENLKQYVIWSFGSFEGLTGVQVIVFCICVFLGIMFAILAVRMLIGYLLGEEYARLLGVKVQLLRVFIILSVSLLVGSTTAMLGPIVFIGIIIPYFCRQLWNPSKLWKQLILNAMLGMVFMLLVQLVMIHTQLPVNILSSIIGIPVILFMIMGNKFKSLF